MRGAMGALLGAVCVLSVPAIPVLAPGVKFDARTNAPWVAPGPAGKRPKEPKVKARRAKARLARKARKAQR